MKHALGFHRYELRAFGYRLRLHVWLRGQISEDRHNHQYAFVSMPLFGRFEESRWMEVPGDEYRQMECFTGSKTAPMRVLAAPSRSGLRLVSRAVRWPLRPWMCPQTAVHSLRPLGRFAVSLVLCGRVLERPSDVWRRA